MFGLINQYRVQNSLAPFTLDQRISDIAQTHAVFMAGQRMSSDTGFAQRLVSIQQLYPGAVVAEQNSKAGCAPSNVYISLVETCSKFLAWKLHIDWYWI